MDRLSFNERAFHIIKKDTERRRIDLAVVSTSVVHEHYDYFLRELSLSDLAGPRSAIGRAPDS